MTIDKHRDPLPTARDAINLKGILPSADVVFLAQALIVAHDKVDQLYSTLESRSDATRRSVEQVLRDTASTAPSTAACRALRTALRTALDRGPVFEETLVEGPGQADQERLDWLAQNTARLSAVQARIREEALSLREAIDGLMPSKQQQS